MNLNSHNTETNELTLHTQRKFSAQVNIKNYHEKLVMESLCITTRSYKDNSHH